MLFSYLQKMNIEEKLQNLGIKWIDSLDNDPLFAHAHLPKKWSKKKENG